MKFKDKIVWITGASSGIGEALAYGFMKEGAKVIISSNLEKELNNVRDNSLKIGAVCVAKLFDLTKADEINQVVDEVIKEFGTVDILINNGGISQRSLAYETPVDLDRKIMEIDYFGAITLTKSLLPHMIKNGSGNIAVTSSISGKFGFPLRSAYSAAKHALHGFYETLGFELKEKNIYVTIVCPGRVKTNISLHALKADGTPHNQMDSGQNLGIPVEECAKKYMNAIHRNKREVYIGGKEIMMVYFKRYLPGIFYKIASKVDPT